MKITSANEKAFLGHKLIVARSGSGMSFPLEDLRRQRMISRVSSATSDRLQLEGAGPVFAEAIANQSTAKLCIKL